MSRGRRSLPCFIFILFFTSALHAKSNFFENEWIVVRNSEVRSQSWKEITGVLRGGHDFVKSFGPQNRFGLFHSAKKTKPLVPPGFSVQRNYRYQTLDSLDPEVEKNWALKNVGQAIGTLEPGFKGVDIKAFDAWEIFKGTKETILAILDTGVDLQHEDLKTNQWNNPKEKENGIDDDSDGYIDDIHGWNFVNQTKNPQDDHMHGTFIAGIIGADAENGKGSRGLNWHISLMSLKILDSAGQGSTERAVSGIQYAVNHGAKIINASWGGTTYDQALYDTIQWANSKGVLFVAASGNSGINNDEGENAMFPASYRIPNIISVASYDNKDLISKTSNFGKETTHIGAPGVQIYSTVPGGGYSIANGTSFAAPYVSGVAALVLGFTKGLSLSALKERVLLTSTPISYYEKETIGTAGRVNALNALKDERPERPKLPTTWKRFPYNFATSHPYNNYDVVDLKITHPGAQHIRVHFKRFVTEKKYDIAVVTDSLGRKVGTMSGEYDDTLSSDALGDTYQLQFKADYAKTEYGIDVDYYEVNFGEP